MTHTIVACTDVEYFDEILGALSSAPMVTLDADGQRLHLPGELVDVVRQAADLFASGRAVEVSAQARARFL